MRSRSIGAPYSSVASLFSSGNLPRVLTDSTDVADVYTTAGFECALFDELSNGDSVGVGEALVILTQANGSPTLDELRELLKQSAVLWLPLVSFAADRVAVEYSAQRLRTIDFSAACASNAIHLDMFETQRSPLRVVTDGCVLRVELGTDLHLSLPKLQPAISPGEWVSIAQFIELAMIPNEHNDAFVADGEILCDGVSVAHHRAAADRSGPPSRRAWEELAAVRQSGGFPLRIRIARSRVLSIRTSTSTEIIHKLMPLTDRMLRGAVTEVSFAALPADPTVDWSINSQVNEASGGVHVGIGAGIEAAHIDFIASEAQVDRGSGDECDANAVSAAGR